jgi:hypothetical protein
MTVSFFTDGRLAAVTTGCRMIVIGVSWDLSGSWISFEVPARLSAECAADLAERDSALAAAIEGATFWSITNDRAIVLHGVTDIRLERLEASSASP